MKYVKIGFLLSVGWYLGTEVTKGLDRHFGEIFVGTKTYQRYGRPQ